MAELSFLVETPDAEAEERFVREFVPPAARPEESYDVLFVGRYAAAADVDGGRVKVSFEGDPEPILAREGDRLDELPFVDDWEAEVDADGDTRATEAEQELVEQFARVAGRMNEHYFQAVDERPPVGEVTDDRFHTRGIWVLVHFLLNGQGYSPEEEVEALFLALRDRLARIGAEEDTDRVRELVAELQDRLDETETRIDRDLLDG